MEVRWLLTNRKHGGKTKSVSVLKAALKKRRDGGREQKSWLLMTKKEEKKKKLSKSDGGEIDLKLNLFFFFF